MRPIRIFEHISLDGVIQHSADDDDFPYRDWTVPYRTLAGRDAILTAQGERFWPTAPRSPMADRLNAATKYIATHRPESLEWGPVESLGPDIVARVRARRHERNAVRHHRQYVYDRGRAPDHSALSRAALSRSRRCS